MTNHIEIAKKLGVSTATVSNALAGKGRMGNELRCKILEIAAQEGYVSQRKKSYKRSNRINIVTERLDVYFCQQIISGISAAARAEGFAIQIYDLNISLFTDSRTPPNEWIAEMTSEYMDYVDDNVLGLIYVSQYPRDLTGVLPKKHYPAVYTYGYISDGSCCVNCNDEQGAFQATKRLLENGGKKTAMICGPVNNVATSNRYIGFQRALIDRGLSLDHDMIAIEDWTLEDGYDAMRKFILKNKLPDSIFVQNDLMAVGAMRAALEYGLRIPQDIAVIGFDDTDYAPYTLPALTSVNPSLKQVGAKAFHILTDITRGNRLPQKSFLIPCTLSLRDSG